MFSARCPRKSTSNEDAAALIAVDNDTGVMMVADGMGGAAAGDQAALIALRNVRDELQGLAQDDLPIRGAILNGIEKANRAVVDLGVGAATTLAAVELQSGRARTYHVGDSMILVVGQRGKIKLRTVSHSPVGYAVESGMMDHEEAMHHEDRHLVSNMIGTADMRIEVGSTVTLAPRDTVVLASDGLFDNLHEHEIVDAVRKGPLSEAVEKLTGLAQKRMNDPVPGQPSKCDDLTVVAFRSARKSNGSANGSRA